MLFCKSIFFLYETKHPVYNYYNKYKGTHELGYAKIN